MKITTEHVTIRSCDITALVRVLEGTRALDPESAVTAMRDAITELVRHLDNGPFDEADRELLRSAVANDEDTGRTSGIDLVLLPKLPKLRRRHQETLDYLLTGATEKEIAVKLGLSVHTVHQYVKAIYRRFHVSSRAQLMASRLRPIGSLATGT